MSQKNHSMCKSKKKKWFMSIDKQERSKDRYIKDYHEYCTKEHYK